tara:strand:+ start:1024 stop:2280 length:1257 start_codon:yes stop_codon:yes gene_type:complete
MSCNICCEKYTKTTRKEIKHNCCDFSCCLKCFRTYLTSGILSAKCMNCEKDITLDFITEVTPNSFHNKEYRKYRTKIILSREESLLPQTQHIVERIHKSNKLEDQIEELFNQRDELAKQIRLLRKEQYNLENINYDETKEKRKTFIKRCGVNDCRGFLSSAWKCGTCQTYSCPTCLQPKKEKNDSEHECKKEDIATAEVLQKGTKPCPNCAALIFFIEGCDQMWCVLCHTSFSWKTGKIETGVIHNPHFYQWQRNMNNGVTPRIQGEIRCGGLPWTETLRQIFRLRNIKFHNWIECYRSVHHIREIEINRIYREIDPITQNRELRVKYLLKEIDKDKWEKELQKINKRNEKNLEIRQILNMYITTLTDLFCTFANDTLEGSLEKTCINLRHYVNNELKKISKRYKNVTPHIKNEWTIQ